MDKLGTVTVVNKYKHTPTKHDYYIGRGSPVGNKWTHLKTKTKAEIVVDTRQESIDCFEDYLDNVILGPMGGDEPAFNYLSRMRDDLIEGNDIYLVCYCKPKNCHGDVIKKALENSLVMYLTLRDEN